MRTRAKPYHKGIFFSSSGGKSAPDFGFRLTHLAGRMPDAAANLYPVLGEWYAAAIADRTKRSYL